MELLQETPIDCPYCGETITVLIDTSVDEQEYIEDCQVCCRPIVIRTSAHAGGSFEIEARHENET
jgi:transposase-like protein